MPEHKPKYFQYIIGGVLIVVGIILIASIFKNDDVAILPKTNDVLDETTRIVEATNYEYQLTSEWDLYDHAIVDIQSLAEGQEIEFGILRDPLEPEFVYFSTSALDRESDEMLLSLYKYNETDYSFERLWRHSHEVEEMYWLESGYGLAKMHVLGYENNKLILLMQDVDDSPGPCSQPWLMGWKDDSMRNMITIDLSDPYGGFEEYTPNDDVVQTAEDALDQCQNSL